MFEIIGTVLVCFVVADFLTGFFHWLEDTYCLEGLPLVGQIICEPNIVHHLDPNLMVRTGNFFSRNILSWSIGAVAAAAAWLVGLGGWPVYLTLLFASFGNEIHRWNHMNYANRFAEFLKDAGLVQSRKQHSMHHKPPFTSNYCILGSFTNAVLERITFWRRLETAVELVTGISPKRENRRDYAMAKKAVPDDHEETPNKQNLAA